MERWEDSESPFNQKRQRDEEEEDGEEEGEEGEWIVGDDEGESEGEEGEERRVRKRQRMIQRNEGEPRGSGQGVKVGKRSQNP